MAVDVERIIQCIWQGDQDNVQTQLDSYNTEQRELEEFRRNKVREYVPDSDSDLGSDDDEDADLILRRRLAEALIWFVRTQLQPAVLRVCLRTLRILSRDRQALAPLITDSAILTLAQLGGIANLPLSFQEEDEEGEADEYQEANSDGEMDGCSNMAFMFDTVNTCLANRTDSGLASTAGANVASMTQSDGTHHPRSKLHTSPADSQGRMREVVIETHSARREPSRNDGIGGVLERGKKDARGEKDEEGDEWYDDRDVWRKEAMKTLCNVIYNSQRAQERASALRILQGLSEKLKESIHSASPPSGQFYDLRLLFLLTALRPELRQQLRQARGVSMLTAVLEHCLEARWAEDYQVVTDTTSPPIGKDVSQRAIEVLKILFNIAYSMRRQEPDEEDTALYRHLAAVLRHCMLLSCEEEVLAEELKGHTVNLLSALPLRCLDVLLCVRLSEVSEESGGVNMDCVHSLLVFMERRLDRGHKLKEKLTPVLSLLTESCKAHRETRHYLKQQILPPLREVTLRPEQGDALRNKLVRLMTHVDTELKHCAAELLFVLCKENVARFVKYTGYGNAAGLLAARGLLTGRSPSSHTQYSSDSDSDTEEYRRAKGMINPVTGRVEEQQPDPMEGMTEEEKETEALRLISMFNRLSRDRIIQPAGVTADGRLAPLCGQMRNDILEADEADEGDGDSEVD